MPLLSHLLMCLTVFWTHMPSYRVGFPRDWLASSGCTSIKLTVLSVDRVSGFPHEISARHSNLCDVCAFPPPPIALPRQVRIVYFNAAATFEDDDFKARLGVQSFFVAPLTNAPAVKFTGALNNGPIMWCACLSNRYVNHNVPERVWLVKHK